jgi:hypothetical protein
MRVKNEAARTDGHQSAPKTDSVMVTTDLSAGNSKEDQKDEMIILLREVVEVLSAIRDNQDRQIVALLEIYTRMQ